MVARTCVYIEDVVIFSKTSKEPLNHFESVLQLTSKLGMMLVLRKCFLFSDAVDYLGHLTTPRRLHIATKTIKALRDLKYPMTTFKLRSFLRLCNGYRQFAPNVL